MLVGLLIEAVVALEVAEIEVGLAGWATPPEGTEPPPPSGIICWWMEEGGAGGVEVTAAAEATDEVGRFSGRRKNASFWSLDCL